MVRKLGHEDYIALLVDYLLPKYEKIEQNVEYAKGEIDIQAFRGTQFDIYEVKCEGHKDKAIEQLQRAKRYFKRKCGRAFYYNGRTNTLEEI